MFPDLGLEEIGLDFDPRGGVKVDHRGATNLPGVWAAGDVTGQAWLAHAASRMAEVVVHNITGQKGSYAPRYYARSCLHQPGGRCCRIDQRGSD